MASPARVREFRFKASTTFSTNHSNAAESGWNAADGTVHKLQITGYDDSGLERPGIPCEAIKERFHQQDAFIPGLARGSLKFSTYLAGAYSNTDTTPEFNVLAACLGGCQAVANARSTTVQAAVDTVNIDIDSINTHAVAGQAVLVGVKGDGRGGGEVKPINSVDDQNHIGLSIATSVAAAASDAIVVSTTVYPDETATQQYIDALMIGKATADQRQVIGAMGSFGISGLGVGELPKIDFDLAAADHQWVAVGDRTTITSGTSPQGGDPAMDKAIGLVHIGDHGTSTRTCFKCGDISITSPGLTYEDIPAPCGINGIGGHQHMPGVPTIELTVLMDEDFGLVADFAAQTAKTLMLQFGHTAGKCVAIELPKCYLDAEPVPAALGNLSGMRLKFHGTEDVVSGNELRSAAIRIHQF